MCNVHSEEGRRQELQTTTVWAANVLPFQAPFCYWQFWWEIRDRKIQGECDCRASAGFHNPDNLGIKTIHVYPRSLRRENCTLPSTVMWFYYSAAFQLRISQVIKWFDFPFQEFPPTPRKAHQLFNGRYQQLFLRSFLLFVSKWSPCIKTKNNPKKRPSTAVWL